nr:tyrosine-type recombinase/integrase [Pseudomonas palleroniana]
MLEHEVGSLAFEFSGKGTALFGHLTPRSGEHSRLNGCPESLDHYTMTTSMLRGRFDAARLKAGIEKSAFQMRDLRAKAATDEEESTGSIRDARDQLGHTTVGMTEQYIRRRKGLKVLPTK